ASTCRPVGFAMLPMSLLSAKFVNSYNFRRLHEEVDNETDLLALFLGEPTLPSYPSLEVGQIVIVYSSRIKGVSNNLSQGSTIISHIVLHPFAYTFHQASLLDRIVGVGYHHHAVNLGKLVRKLEVQVLSVLKAVPPEGSFPTIINLVTLPDSIALRVSKRPHFHIAD